MKSTKAHHQHPSNWNEISEFYFNRCAILLVRQLRSIKKICAAPFTFYKWQTHRKSFWFRNTTAIAYLWLHIDQIRLKPFAKIISFCATQNCLFSLWRKMQTWCGKPQRLRLVFRNRLKSNRQCTVAEALEQLKLATKRSRSREAVVGRLESV